MGSGASTAKAPAAAMAPLKKTLLRSPTSPKDARKARDALLGFLSCTDCKGLPSLLMGRAAHEHAAGVQEPQPCLDEVLFMYVDAHKRSMHCSTLDAVKPTLSRLRELLRWDLLQDTWERAVFSIDASNVEQELELRLALLTKYVSRIECGDYKRGGINEKTLEELNLHSQDGLLELYKRYIPLSILLHRRLLAFRMSSQTQQAWVIGVNAPPGSGKSSMTMVIVFILSLLGIRAESVSTDDMYMSQAERKQATPKIETRLDPRSLDAERAAGILHDMIHLGEGAEMEWPCFDKGQDDRKRGNIKTGPFDVIILEGWRVCVAAGQLNNSWFDYTPLNKMVNYLVCIDVPSYLVRDWKFESTKRDYYRTHWNIDKHWTVANTESFNLNYNTWIEPFHLEHELPLTRSDGPAQIVIHKGCGHKVLQIEVHEVES